MKIRDFLSPLSKDENAAQRESILNILLFGCACLFSLNWLAFFSRFLILKFSGAEAQGGSPVIILLVTLVVWGLLWLSKKGFFKISAIILVLVFLFSALLCGLNWGADLPQTLILIATTITLAGIIISPAASFYVFIASMVGLLLIIYFEQSGLFKPDAYWRQQSPGYSDLISYSITFIILALISWISNRKIEKSLDRAIRSEDALKKERDSLEEKVIERTAELKKIQLEKMSQVAQFTELGKSVGGILHDIVNPLTALSLNLSQAKKQKLSDNLDGTQKYLNQAISASKKLDQFVLTLRKQIKNKDDKKIFELSNEINDAIKLMNFKANTSNCIIVFNNFEVMPTYNSPLKFSQVILNLISNALDAYKSCTKDNKTIKISLEKFGKHAKIIVSDNGVGINRDCINKIFDPFYSSKNNEGIGMGLTLTKNIIENDFGGEISVKSEDQVGTTFIVKIPLQSKNV